MTPGAFLPIIALLFSTALADQRRLNDILHGENKEEGKPSVTTLLHQASKEGPDTTKGDVTTTTSTAPPFAESGGCRVGKLRYLEGQYIPGGGDACIACYCLRGKVQCTQTKCRQSIPGCTPVFQKGRCCPVGYTCDDKEKTNWKLDTSQGAPIIKRSAPAQSSKGQTMARDLQMNAALIVVDDPEPRSSRTGDRIHENKEAAPLLKDETPSPFPSEDVTVVTTVPDDYFYYEYDTEYEPGPAVTETALKEPKISEKNVSLKEDPVSPSVTVSEVAEGPAKKQEEEFGRRQPVNTEVSTGTDKKGDVRAQAEAANQAEKDVRLGDNGLAVHDDQQNTPVTVSGDADNKTADDPVTDSVTAGMRDETETIIVSANDAILPVDNGNAEDAFNTEILQDSHFPSYDIDVRTSLMGVSDSEDETLLGFGQVIPVDLGQEEVKPFILPTQATEPPTKTTTQSSFFNAFLNLFSGSFSEMSGSRPKDPAMGRPSPPPLGELPPPPITQGTAFEHNTEEDQLTVPKPSLTRSDFPIRRPGSNRHPSARPSLLDRRPESPLLPFHSDSQELPTKPLVEGGFLAIRQTEEEKGNAKPDVNEVNGEDNTVIDESEDLPQKPTLPPSLPNLQIIPFVAEDAILHKNRVTGSASQSPIEAEAIAAVSAPKSKPVHDETDKIKRRKPPLSEVSTSLRPAFKTELEDEDRKPPFLKRPAFLPPRKPIQSPSAAEKRPPIILPSRSKLPGVEDEQDAKVSTPSPLKLSLLSLRDRIRPSPLREDATNKEKPSHEETNTASTISESTERESGIKPPAFAFRDRNSPISRPSVIPPRRTRPGLEEKPLKFIPAAIANKEDEAISSFSAAERLTTPLPVWLLSESADRFQNKTVTPLHREDQEGLHLTQSKSSPLPIPESIPHPQTTGEQVRTQEGTLLEDNDIFIPPFDFLLPKPLPTTRPDLKDEDILNFVLQDKLRFPTNLGLGVRHDQEAVISKLPKPFLSTTTALPDIPNSVKDQLPLGNDPLLVSGLLELAGCNIYGRLYDVGDRIEVMSGRCKECQCTPVGVQCLPIC